MRKLTDAEKAEIRAKFPQAHYSRVVHFFSTQVRYGVSGREQAFRNATLTAGGCWDSDTTDAVMYGLDFIFPK